MELERLKDLKSQQDKEKIEKKKTNLQRQVEEMENEIKNSKERNLKKREANERELKKLKDKEKEKEEEILVHLNFNHYLKTLSDFLRDNSDVKNPEKIIESFQTQKNLFQKLTFILNKKYEIDTDKNAKRNIINYIPNKNLKKSRENLEYYLMKKNLIQIKILYLKGI